MAYGLCFCVGVRAQGKIYRQSVGLAKIFTAVHEPHTKPQRARLSKPYCSIGLLGKTISLSLRRPPYTVH
jgi:hypothetical protein